MMRVITVASGKGGVGKTTLCSALGVQAAALGKRVALVDLDPMQSLAGWWRRRGQPTNPEIFGNAEFASEAVEALRLHSAHEIAIIDTPPAFVNVIEDAVQAADLVIVPIKPSALDLVASEDVVKMCEEAGKTYLVVINDAELSWRATTSARDYLLAANIPIAEQSITHRSAYLSAMGPGKTGPEIDKKDKKGRFLAREEIAELWKEVWAAANKAVKAKEGAHA